MEDYWALFDTPVDRSQSNAEKYRAMMRLFGTESVMPLWVADMEIMTPPFVVQAVQARAAHPIYGYESMSERAYESQMAWVARRFGWELKREWIFESPSVVASINLAIMAFSESGDEVIVQPPIYPPFMTSVRHQGRELILNPLTCNADGSYGFDLDDLKRKITPRTKMLLLCSPHNPVGRVWKREELEALVRLCAEYGIIILSDEIHADLTYAPHIHTPLSTLGYERVLTAMGPGKTFNLAGMGLSTLAMSDEGLRQRFKAVYDAVHFGQGNIFAHTAFEAAYRDGEAWVEALLPYLRRNRDLLQETLRDTPLTCKAAEGTYLAWIDCRALGLEDKALRSLFVAAGLGLSAGLGFGREGSGFMRLNFAAPYAQMQEAMQRLKAVSL
ncbi:MAG: PatB family C-S lyase [Campylobacterales bacterium]|nr:PatB family C-S lyase [Campylobacterales bacterium]